MRIIKGVVTYQQKQNLLIDSNKKEIEQSNGNLTHAILVMGCGCFAVFTIFSLLVDSYSDLSSSYIVMLAALCLFLLFFNRLRERFSTACLIYAGYFLLICYSIYTSAFVTPDFISVIILFLLFQIPIVTIDKSWRVNLVVIFYMALYMCTAIPCKDARLVPDEILNCLLFTSFGIGLGEILRKARLENFELKRQALLRENTDYLTGLNNRKNLFQRLGDLRDETNGQTGPGLLMIDIDHFKLYNDTFGHQAGDDCLKRIAGCFLTFGEKHEMAFYRYGGEEFVGICTSCSGNELLRLGEDLNHAIMALKIPHDCAESPYVSVSIGAAIAEEGIKDNYEQSLLSRADIALYTAKTLGRNRSVSYAEGMRMEGLEK